MSHKIIRQVFNYAAKSGAKSLIMESGAEQFSFHYNFADQEKQSFTLPKKLESTLISSLKQILKIMPDELATKKYCKIYDKNYQIAFQLSVLPDKFGEKIIINIIDKKPKLRSLKQLGLQADERQRIKTALQQKSGLIIISSPADNGKSDTLNSLLHELDSEKLDIYLLNKTKTPLAPGLNHLKLSSANLEKIIKTGADVIAIDDLEENSIFQQALRAAASGHLVIGALSAASTWEVIMKILKLDMPLKIKLDGLKLIINQRVVKMKRPPKGRVSVRNQIGVFEVLSFNNKLASLINNFEESKSPKKFWENLAATAIKDGFRPLAQDWEEKINKGLV